MATTIIYDTDLGRYVEIDDRTGLIVNDNPPQPEKKTLASVLKKKVGQGVELAKEKIGDVSEATAETARHYFGKRTPEEIEAEKEAEELRKQQIASRKQRQATAQIINESGDAQTQSRFREDISRVARGTKTLVNKGITLSKPIVKTIVKGVKKTAVSVGKTSVQVGKTMGKGMAKIDEEEKAKKSSPNSTSPQKQQKIQPAREPVNKPQKPYNDDFFVSGGLGKRGSGGNSEFSIGGGSRKAVPPQKKASSGKPQKPYNDDYFVGGRKKNGGSKEDDDYFVSSKKPSQKPPKKGKGNTGRGFGLGF